MSSITLQDIQTKVQNNHYANAVIDIKDPLVQDRNRFELRMEFYRDISQAFCWNSIEQELFLTLVTRSGNYQELFERSLRFNDMLIKIREQSQ